LPLRGAVHHLSVSNQTDAAEDRPGEDESAEVAEERRIRESDAEQPQPVAKTSSGDKD
jgi:hypothetical protein